MTISPFGWHDLQAGGTPLDSANLEACLAQAGAYTDASLIALQPIRTPIANDYQAMPSDTIIAVVDTTVPRQVTLADPATLLVGQQVIIKDESGGAGANAIVAIGLIDGASSATINTNFGVLWLYSTGNGYAALINSPLPSPISPPTLS